MRLRILATIAIDPLFEIIRTIVAINSCTCPRSHFGTSSVPPPTTMGADPASAFFFWREIAMHIQQEGSLSPGPLWVHPEVSRAFSSLREVSTSSWEAQEGRVRGLLRTVGLKADLVSREKHFSVDGMHGGIRMQCDFWVELRQLVERCVHIGEMGRQGFLHCV